MHKNRIVNAATVVFGIVSLVCLVGYLLALQDIFQDYVSPKAVREQAGIAPGSLPLWTTCQLEWSVIRMGFLPMLIFHALFFVNQLCRRRGMASNQTLPIAAAMRGC